MTLLAPRSRWGSAILLLAVLALGCATRVEVTVESDTPPAGPPVDGFVAGVATGADVESFAVVDQSDNIVGEVEIEQVSPNEFEITGDVIAGANQPTWFTIEAHSSDALSEDGTDFSVQFFSFTSGPTSFPPAHGPLYVTRLDEELGLVTDVINFYPFPIYVHTFEGAGLEAPIFGEELTYDNVSSITFTPGIIGTTLAPGSTTTVEWPEWDEPLATTSAEFPPVVLLRAKTSMFQPTGPTVKTVWHQETREQPLTIRQTTWGAVKAMYR